MDLYARLSDKSLLKLYRIARHCGDFVRANNILQVLQDRIPRGLSDDARAGLKSEIDH